MKAPYSSHMLEIEFTDNGTLLRQTDIENIPEMVAALSNMKMKDRLSMLLKGGLMSVDDLADATDATIATVRTVLYRYKDLFNKEGEEWGLR